MLSNTLLINAKKAVILKQYFLIPKLIRLKLSVKF